MIFCGCTWHSTCHAPRAGRERRHNQLVGEVEESDIAPQVTGVAQRWEDDRHWISASASIGQSAHLSGHCTEEKNKNKNVLKKIKIIRHVLYLLTLETNMSKQFKFLMSHTLLSVNDEWQSLHADETVHYSTLAATFTYS